MFSALMLKRASRPLLYHYSGVFPLFLLVLHGMSAPAFAISEFEIAATSFTVDNQLNISSVAYFQQKTTVPGNPATATNLTSPGGLYFDGTYYNVWNTSAWVQLATGAAAGAGANA